MPNPISSRACRIENPAGMNEAQMGLHVGCGVLWEFWNYWSGAKWIYAIPFFNYWKVFEMPLVGYLGFMPFALECYLFWQLLRLVRESYAGRNWRIFVVIAPLVVAYCALVFYGIDNFTVIWSSQ